MKEINNKEFEIIGNIYKLDSYGQKIEFLKQLSYILEKEIGSQIENTNGNEEEFYYSRPQFDSGSEESLYLSYIKYYVDILKLKSIDLRRIIDREYTKFTGIKKYKDYSILSEYKYSTQENIDKVKNILKSEQLYKNINLRFESINLDINIKHITNINMVNVRKFRLDDDNTLNYNGEKIESHIYIGGWSDKARIEDVHVALYTSSSKIGGNRFCQIELSNCIEDTDYIYILKNLSSLGGSGSIIRLNKNSIKKSHNTEENQKRDQDLKLRRIELTKRLDSQVIHYNEKDWICIYKFNKKKLDDKEYRYKAFYEFIINFLLYAFTIESIIIEAKGNKNITKENNSIQNTTNLPGYIIKERSKKASRIPKTNEIKIKSFVRDKYVSEYAKRRANGICQLCKKEAPFKDKNDRPYLETHHIKWLSAGGEDSIDNTVALCPNCHRKMHSLNLESDINKLKNQIKSCALE